MSQDCIRLHYKDPSEYDRVSFAELLVSEKDCVCFFPTLQPSGQSFPNRLFHDYVGVPICNVDSITINSNGESFLLLRHDVYITGYRCFVGGDGLYNIDDSYDNIGGGAAYLAGKLPQGEQWANEKSSFQGDANGMFLDLSRREVVEIEAPVVNISSDEVVNYGSFLVRVLPKIMDAIRFSPDVRVMLPLYASSMRALIEASGIAPERIIHQDLDKIYKVRKVYMPNIKNKSFWLDAPTRSYYDIMRLQYGQPRLPERRLFISRKAYEQTPQSGHSRKLLNEDQVFDCVKRFGYEYFCPETVSPRQQIAMFSSASSIVGPAGSALFNAVFCRPGTTLIDIESEPHWFSNHVRLFESLDLNYAILEGDPIDRSFQTHHVPFRVDVDRLYQRLLSMH